MIAFQGEPGAWSEAALLQHFGADAQTLAVPTFEQVFEAIAAGNAAAGVVPIENSLAGSILENHDLLLQHDELSIVGELRHQIRHCLLAAPSVELADVQYCWSHPQALAQSMPWLREHGIEPRASYNTAGAARDLAAGGDAHGAAIASERAAQLYGLHVLARDIQTRDDNNTRFLVIGRERLDERPADMASLVYTTPNTPGALQRSLGVFAALDLNLTKLESRPTRDTPWEYWFWVDLERADRAAIDDQLMTDLREHLAPVTDQVRLLGVYPRG